MDWHETDRDRKSTCRSAIQRSSAAENIRAPPSLSADKVVAGFGSGPCHVEAELARRVGREDRITAGNTIMDMDDPMSKLHELHRVLRTNGIAHVIDDDWFMTVVENILQFRRSSL